MSEALPDDTPQPDDDRASVAVTIEQVLDVLENGEMETTHGLLRYSSNHTFLVTMCKDDIQVPAVYKPRRGERPLWDFPDGTLCNRERAAFLTSDVLEWGIVPPTALRGGSHGTGSVQFYIDHDPEINYFSLDEQFTPQLARLALFDVLVNNADRKGGHCLLDESRHIWAIDHGITFNKEHKLRTVIWDFAGQPIPDVLLEDVGRLCMALEDADSPFLTKLSELLNSREIDAFRQRVERVMTTQTYPKPGPGPNYPWPAV